MRFLFKHERYTPAAVPQPAQAKVPELVEAEIAAVYSAQRMAGDFYDFIRVRPDRVLFGLLDVAGRLERTRAPLLAAQGTFRTLAPQLFAAEDMNEADAMIRLCLELNRTILQAAEDVCSCPAFVGSYNESLGTVCYVNAGHPPGLLRDHAGVTELAATGLPLGLFSHATCDAPMVALEPGAALLLVSQGMIEGKYRREEFGLERVKDSLVRANSASAKDLCVAVLEDVQTFMRTPPVHNDVTALALVHAAAGKALAAGQA